MTQTTRACAGCGTDISARHWRAVRCEPCAAERERQQLRAKKPTTYERTCEQCGTAYNTRNKHQLYCGVRCSGRASHPGNVTHACIVCDTTFSISKQYDRATCSRPCTKWARENPGRKPVRACQRCGASLAGRMLTTRFCSATCSVAVNYRAKGRTKTTRVRPAGCIVCGHSLEGRTHSAVYCSRPCQALRNHQYRSAKLRDAPVERVSHAAVFERDDWTCHLCGDRIDRTLRNKHPQMVSLDHVIPVSDPDYPGHVWENLAAAHLRCNTVKGGRATERDWNLYRKLLAERLTERGWCKWWTPEERNGTPLTLSA